MFLLRPQCYLGFVVHGFLVIHGFLVVGWDVKVWMVVLYFNQAEIHHVQAMHDPSLTEENFGLLGEESHRSGQALRLGYVVI